MADARRFSRKNGLNPDRSRKDADFLCYKPLKTPQKPQFPAQISSKPGGGHPFAATTTVTFPVYYFSGKCLLCLGSLVLRRFEVDALSFGMGFVWRWMRLMDPQPPFIPPSPW